MPLIPRQVKPPAQIAITCKVPEAVATLLKLYAAFLESSQEHVVTETLCLAFRRDREFQAWLATTHPEARLADRLPGKATTDQPRETTARRERSGP